MSPQGQEANTIRPFRRLRQRPNEQQIVCGGSDSRFEVDGWFPPDRGQDNDLIQIRVRLKSDAHEGAAWLWRLASASFQKNIGSAARADRRWAS
jgi:hypothetical protein